MQAVVKQLESPTESVSKVYTLKPVLLRASGFKSAPNTQASDAMAICSPRFDALLMNCVATVCTAPEEELDELDELLLEEELLDELLDEELLDELL